jgi:hypothetical protein
MPLEAIDNCVVIIDGQWSRAFDNRVLPGVGLARNLGRDLFRGLRNQGGV